MIHRVKLYLLQKRNDILLFVGMTSILTTLVLVFASLVLLHKQSSRNEQILKGLSCILLIMPQDRTQEKVSNCIKLNNPNDSEFLFKTLEAPQQADVSVEPVEDKTLFLVPIKGDKGDPGERGPAGQPGASIKGDKGDTVTIQGLDGKDGAQGEPGASGREVEFMYNDDKKRIEWHYVGDDGWQILVDQCKLTDTCEE